MPPRVTEIHRILLAHLEDLYLFYGTETGVRIARKHISWYTKGLVGSAAFRHMMNQLPTIAPAAASGQRLFPDARRASRAPALRQ
ncbi:tRNA-dihydrouridine synthase [Candidatus Accumulibacter sp. ACC012]|uniref:tRNA-dihydrouridine synthase n=1 Tax=Candidatus Accumulibacter sp. ACC012 TaxID=2823332 RepID=UPI00342274C5